MANPYRAFLSVTKIRNKKEVIRSAGHTFREFTVKNADPHKTPLNQNWRPVTNSEQLWDKVLERSALASEKRNDSVLCLEVLITANRYAYSLYGGSINWEDYLKKALEWLEETFGKANVVAVNIQLDEAAPHMVAYIIPLVHREASVRKYPLRRGLDSNGQRIIEMSSYTKPARLALSAYHYIGSPAKLVKMQDDFYLKVGKTVGLNRGIKGSRSKHKHISKFYAALNEGMVNAHYAIKPEEFKRQRKWVFVESLEEVEKRISGSIESHYAPALARATKLPFVEERCQQLEATLDSINTKQEILNAYHHREMASIKNDLSATKEKLGNLVNGLSHSQIRLLENTAKGFREDNERARARNEQEKKERAIALIRKLKQLTVEDFAKLKNETRRKLWPGIVINPELSELFDRLSTSHLFDARGGLTKQGQAFVNHLDQRPMNSQVNDSFSTKGKDLDEGSQAPYPTMS